MKSKPVILWFRQDLRLSDNPALIAATATGAPILPVYILDDDNADEWRIGGASRWWLHHSLTALDKSMNGALAVYKGKADEIIPALMTNTGATEIHWNRCYEPWRITRDKAIKTARDKQNIGAYSHNGSLLWEPWETLKSDDTPYKAFTAFYKNGCLGKNGEPHEPQNKPVNIEWLAKPSNSLSIKDLALLPDIKWYSDMNAEWEPGEDGAIRRLETFLQNGLSDYSNGRDRPDLRNVSRLSPHLHWGEISPHRVWHRATTHMYAEHMESHGEKFRAELGWREFSHSLLFYFPDLPRNNLQQKFDIFPWREDNEALDAWKRGMTGYPIIDAGMRELWQTGYMHNRVRMIVGSFLVKNLMLHWHHGEDWFWDTLVDADLANNSASWQWIAGCGADAAPYFRIFNPVAQSAKFDPNGDYIRKYVPEIAALPDKYLHTPWEAPPPILQQAGIVIGETYPAPIVDLKETRERALAAFQSIK